MDDKLIILPWVLLSILLTMGIFVAAYEYTARLTFDDTAVNAIGSANFKQRMDTSLQATADKILYGDQIQTAKETLSFKVMDIIQTGNLTKMNTAIACLNK